MLLSPSQAVATDAGSQIATDSSLRQGSGEANMAGVILTERGNPFLFLWFTKIESFIGI